MKISLCRMRSDDCVNFSAPLSLHLKVHGRKISKGETSERISRTNTRGLDTSLIVLGHSAVGNCAVFRVVDKVCRIVFYCTHYCVSPIS